MLRLALRLPNQPSRLIQERCENMLIRCPVPLAVLLDGKEGNTPVTEKPRVGATELWEVINLAADTHPIPLHRVQFQLWNRQRFHSSYSRAYNALNPVLPTTTTIIRP